MSNIEVANAELKPCALYELQKITNTQTFDNMQQLAQNASYHSIQMTEATLGDSWLALYQSILPGHADDETIAAFLEIKLQNLTSCTPEQLKDVTDNVFIGSCKQFSKENIFSCFSSQYENDIVITVFFIPIKKRIPNVQPWIKSHTKATPRTDVMQAFDQLIAQVFPEFTITQDDAELTPEAKGYQKALIEYKCHNQLREDNVEQFYNVVDPAAQVQTHLPSDTIKRIVNEIIETYTTGTERTIFELTQRHEKTSTEFFESIQSFMYRRWKNKIDDHDKDYILERLQTWAFGYYLLDPLINDDNISDIKVYGPDLIRVKVNGGRYTASNVKFVNDMDYYMFLKGLSTRKELPFEYEPINVFSDTQTNDKFRLRLNLTNQHLNSGNYPILHIRKIAKNKRGFDYLLEQGMLDEEVMHYLIDRARYGPGMVFTGKGASGKTTLMNALLDKIPFNRSGLIIQESEELFSDVHPDLAFEHILSMTYQQMHGLNTAREYNLQALAQNGLLTDLDYFVIGEIKGAEAKYFLNAADTGHKCWCSVHGASALEAIDKLADYVTYESKYSRDEAAEMLKNLGTVIFMKDFKVCEIAEISGWDSKNKHLLYTPVYLRPGMDHTAFSHMFA